MLVIKEGDGLPSIHQILVDRILRFLGEELQGGIAYGRHSRLRRLGSVDLDGVDDEEEVEACEGVIRVTGFHGAHVEGDVDDLEIPGEVTVDHRGGTPGCAHHSRGTSQSHLGAFQQADPALRGAGDRTDGPGELVFQFLLQFRVEEGNGLDLFKTAH